MEERAAAGEEAAGGAGGDWYRCEVLEYSPWAQEYTVEWAGGPLAGRRGVRDRLEDAIPSLADSMEAVWWC